MKIINNPHSGCLYHTTIPMRIAASLSLLASLTFCLGIKSFSATLPAELQANLKRLSSESKKTVFYSYEGQDSANFLYSEIAPVALTDNHTVAFKHGFLVINDGDSLQIIHVSHDFSKELSEQNAVFDKWAQILDLYSHRSKIGDENSNTVTLTSLPKGSVEFVKDIFQGKLGEPDNGRSIIDGVNLYPERVTVPFSAREYVAVFNMKLNNVALFPLDVISMSYNDEGPSPLTPFIPLSYDEPQLDVKPQEPSFPVGMKAGLPVAGTVFEVASLTKLSKDSGNLFYVDKSSQNWQIVKARSGSIIPIDAKEDWAYIISSAQLKETHVANVSFYSRKAFESYYRKELSRSLLNSFLNNFQKSYPQRMQLNINSLLNGRRKWSQLNSPEKQIVLSAISHPHSGNLVVTKEDLSDNSDLLIEFGLDAHLGLIYTNKDTGTARGAFGVNDMLSLDY